MVISLAVEWLFDRGLFHGSQAFWDLIIIFLILEIFFWILMIISPALLLLFFFRPQICFSKKVLIPLVLFFFTMGAIRILGVLHLFYR